MSVFILLIPFALSTKVLDAGLITQQLLLSMMAISGWLYLLLSREPIRIHKTIWCLGILLFWCCYLFSYQVAINKPEAISWIVKITGYCMLFLMLMLANQNNLLNKIWIQRAVMFTLLISVFYFWLEVFFLRQQGVSLFSGKNLYQVTTLFGNKNLYGSFVLLALIFTSQVLIKDQWIWKIVAFIIIIPAVGSLLFIQTKAVMLGMLVATVLLTWPVLKFVSRKHKLLTWIIPMMALLGGSVIIFFILKHRDKFYVLLNQDTMHERILIWKNTVQLIAQHPWFGVGAGNWQIWFPSAGLEKFLATNHLINDGFLTFQRPHNDFLWVWSEAGLIPFLLFALLFIVITLKQFGKINAAKNNVEFLSYFILGGGWIAFTVISLFDFPLERAGHEILFLMLAAGLIEIEQVDRPKINKVLILPILISLILTCGILLKRFTSEQNMKKILNAQDQSNWDGILTLYPKTVNRFYSLDAFSIPVSWYAGLAQMGKSDAQAALPYFKKSFRENPFQIHVLNNLAGTFERLGMHDSAVYYYDKALNISALQPDVRLNRAAALYNASRLDEAFDAIIEFPYDSTSTQSAMYMRAIIGDYLRKRLDEGDPHLNRQLAKTLSEYPDSIRWYHLYFTQNKLSFKKQIYSNSTHQP